MAIIYFSLFRISCTTQGHKDGYFSENEMSIDHTQKKNVSVIPNVTRHHLNAPLYILEQVNQIMQPTPL